MITPGPNGNLWFTEQSSNNIGEITPTGQITEFFIASNAAPWGIVEGSDGNLWFTDSSPTASAIGRITPSGVITLFTAGLTAGSQPEGITAGPDGNLWFTENVASKIGRISTAGVISQFSLTASSGPKNITTGPDGNLWFTEETGDRIGQMSTAGALIAEYSDGLTLGSEPFGIATGPDGNVWFTEFAAANVGQISPSGVITEFPIPALSPLPETIAVLPGGDLALAESGAGSIGLLDPFSSSASLLTYSVFGGTGTPTGLAVGSDGQLWVTDGVHQIEAVSDDAPAASIESPTVSGSAEVGTSQSCVGDRWQDWASQQPSSPSYVWTLDGTSVVGAVASSYVPPLDAVGQSLSCSVSDTYPLVGTTVAATSSITTLIAQNAGPAGAAGSVGPAGAIGPAGVAGAQGPVGSSGSAGLTGASGSTGTQGVAGVVGASGATGPVGADGPLGPSGATGQNGSAGLTGVTGTNGQKGLTGSTGSQGKVELLTCKATTKTVRINKKSVQVPTTTCTTKVVTGVVKFTIETG